MKKIEILAPAGSYESLVAGINGGADAIYIGGSQFGARAYANNLDENDMLRAIDYVHIHGKNIFLTINTLLKNEELENKLYNYLVQYYKQGIDAVIVQDVGVLSFIHKHFPDLPIHASTQMTLTMSNGVKVLENMGVTRLVTSRELNLSEIRNMRQTTNLEIESFVHGALCYCYSGQCLMSSMIGGRSGNRGRCAQPCRKQYKLKEGNKTISQSNDPYLLSPKDICTLSMIPELIDAGIDSFKIEGRMKRPEYTAFITSRYRKYVDLYLGLGKEKYKQYLNENNQEFQQDMAHVMDIYNRGGFTTGYYNTHNGKNMLSLDRPNHNGVLVGEIIQVKGNKAKINLKEDIYAQDLLEIRENNAGVYEYTVKDNHNSKENVIAKFTPNLPVKKGQMVYRTKNQQLLDKIRAEYIEQTNKVKVRAIFHGKVGKPMVLTLSKDDVTVQVYGGLVENALKQPMKEEKIRTQLSKTNATEYVFEALEIEVDDNIFIPIVEMNELRREGLAQLEYAITQQYRRKHEEDGNQLVTEKAVGMNSTKIIAHILNPQLLDTIASIEEVDCIYMDMGEVEFSEIEFIAKKVKSQEKQFFLVMPHIFRKETYDTFLKNRHAIFHSYMDYIDGYVIKNFEEYDFLITDLFVPPSKIILDYNVYTMNKESKAFYEQLGIDHSTASVELNYSEWKELGCSDSDIIVYGHLPLMVTAQCLLKTTKGCTKKEEVLHLEDRQQKQFYVKNYCRYCYNVIYNSQPLFLLNNDKEIKNLNPKGIRLNFTFESEKEVLQILKAYTQVYKYGRESSFELKEYTKGHFNRGIQ